eukprot:m.925233 g.925233  ORF g.925233 m.925233 type:complete len:740 (+) comp23773_c0_seq10:155-2374(+)
MARTKQTARKSSGGCAPRRQLATPNIRSFRTFMASQQAVGTATASTGSRAAAKGTKSSYINYENTLGEFRFPLGIPTEAQQEFEPRFQTGRSSNATAKTESHFVGINFASKLDNAGIVRHGRPCIDVVFVVDVSGSMTCGFNENDFYGCSPEKSKLGVAKRCIKAMLQQLQHHDTISVLLFNTSTTVLIPQTQVGTMDKADVNATIDSIQSGGGTDLHKGYVDGLSLLPKASTRKSTAKGAPTPLRMSRVMFMTDMQSSLDDEKAVLRTLKKHAVRMKQYTTIVGIGVDLSVGTVETLSCTPGCKYISVSSATEFEESVLTDFAHDVTPIAFDITISLGGGFKIAKGFGSPELNVIKPSATNLKISSEFSCRTYASAAGAEGQGILLIKLQNPATNDVEKVPITTTWKDLAGTSHTSRIVVDLCRTVADSSRAVRKAIVLTKYVDLQADYVLDDDEIGGNTKGTTQTKIAAHAKWIDAFTQFDATLKAEMKACGDDTIYKGNNKNIEQTVQQIIRLEKAEIKGLQQEAAKEAKAAAAKKKLLEDRSLMDAADCDIPEEYRCPISSQLIADPVVAADGYTYERDSIAKWLETSDRSPMTNLKLSSKTLKPNRALKSAIATFVAELKKKKSHVSGASAAKHTGRARAATAASAPAKTTTPRSKRRAVATTKALPDLVEMPEPSPARGRRSRSTAGKPDAASALAIVPHTTPRAAKNSKRRAASSLGETPRRSKRLREHKEM